MRGQGQYQDMLAAERVAASPAEKQTVYQPEDQVLWLRSHDVFTEKTLTELFGTVYSYQAVYE